MAKLLPRKDAVIIGLGWTGSILAQQLTEAGLNVVAIGEDWCPDVVRGMPVIARLCEEAGLDLRIFDRDKNMDLTNEFLWRHKFMCIPVFVLYDKDWNELGHWIEKPASAYKWSADIRTELRTAGLSDEEILPKLRELRAGLEPQWMQPNRD